MSDSDAAGGSEVTSEDLEPVEALQELLEEIVDGRTTRCSAAA
jgi:hypothetical protein